MLLVFEEMLPRRANYGKLYFSFRSTTQASRLSNNAQLCHWLPKNPSRRGSYFHGNHCIGFLKVFQENEYRLGADGWIPGQYHHE